MLWAAFRSFDIDGTGEISIQELQEMLQKSFVRELFSAQTCDELAQEIGVGHLFLGLQKRNREKGKDD